MPYFTLLNIVNHQHYRVVTLTSFDFLTGRARTDNKTGSQVWVLSLSPYQVVCPVCPAQSLETFKPTQISPQISMSPSSLPPCHRAIRPRLGTRSFLLLLDFLTLKILRNLNIIITLSSVLSRIYKIRNKNNCKKFNARKLQAPKYYLATLTSPSEDENKFV